MLMIVNHLQANNLQHSQEKVGDYRKMTARLIDK